MEEMYGFHPGGSDYYSNHNNYLFYPVDTDDDGGGGGGGDYYRFPGFAGFHDGRVPIVVGGHHQDPEVPSAVSDAASAAVTAVGDRREEDISGGIRARIAAHPLYPKLLQAYIDCRKVGAPPDIAGLLEDMEHENDVSGRLAVSSCIGADPELDEFMEAYYHLLAKYKLDLSRPFDEATTFLNHIETQLSSLCSNAATATSSHISDEAAGSDDDFSVGNIELQECSSRTSDDRALKDKLLRKYSGYISSLKLEFSKKKKKGKLPKEARQTLLDWWNTHYKWPYPTEADKVVLAKVTGLDQKQINNWFINQRKRHWKPSENMQYAVMDSSTLFANYNSN